MYYVLFDFVCVFFFFKQKTAYELRISDWSSDVCSSDLFGRISSSGEQNPEPVNTTQQGSAHGTQTAHQLCIGSLPLFDIAPVGGQIGRASCRERVCQYV